MSLFQPEYSMESSRILVLGLPEGTTKTDLKVYFQSITDSEGGGVTVKEIDIDGRQAFVTFKDAQGTYLFMSVRKGKTKSVINELIIMI